LYEICSINLVHVAFRNKKITTDQRNIYIGKTVCLEKKKYETSFTNAVPTIGLKRGPEDLALLKVFLSLFSVMLELIMTGFITTIF